MNTLVLNTVIVSKKNNKGHEFLLKQTDIKVCMQLKNNINNLHSNLARDFLLATLTLGNVEGLRSAMHQSLHF